MKLALLEACICVLACAAAAPSSELDSATPITRKGTELQLNGQRWASPGANVYWLGLVITLQPPQDLTDELRRMRT